MRSESNAQHIDILFQRRLFDQVNSNEAIQHLTRILNTTPANLDGRIQQIQEKKKGPTTEARVNEQRHRIRAAAE
jgi:hypothetical protein